MLTFTPGKTTVTVIEQECEDGRFCVELYLESYGFNRMVANSRYVPPFESSCVRDRITEVGVSNGQKKKTCPRDIGRVK